MSKIDEDMILRSPLDHPELLCTVLHAWLRKGIKEILRASDLHSLIMLQCAQSETSDGRYSRHYELQVAKETEKGNRDVRTFGLQLVVKEDDPCLELCSEPQRR